MNIRLSELPPDLTDKILAAGLRRDTITITDHNGEEVAEMIPARLGPVTGPEHYLEALTEREAIEYIKSLALLEQEPDHRKAVIRLGPWTAFVLVGALQLATRHPEMSLGHRELIGQVIGQLRPVFTGTPAEQLLQLGDDPAKDIYRDCQYPFGPHSPKCPPGGHAGFTAEGDDPGR
jgi:hypothetical protein